MKKIFFLSCILQFVIFYSYSQCKIEYIPPISVQDSIFVNVFQQSNIDSSLFEYVCLYNVVNNETEIIITNIIGFEEIIELSRNSNRCIKVQEQKIPIIFYSDFKYSTIFNIDNSTYITTKDTYILGGYMCKYNGRFKSGDLLFSGWVW